MLVRDSSSIRFTPPSPDPGPRQASPVPDLSGYGRPPSSSSHLSYLRVRTAASTPDGLRGYGVVYPNAAVPAASPDYALPPQPVLDEVAAPGANQDPLARISSSATAAVLGGLMDRRQFPGLTAIGQQHLALHQLPAIDTAGQFHEHFSQAFADVSAQARTTGKPGLVIFGEVHESRTGLCVLDSIGRLATHYKAQTGSNLPVFLEESAHNWNVYEEDAQALKCWPFDFRDRKVLARLWREHRGDTLDRTVNNAIAYFSLAQAPVNRFHVDGGADRTSWRRDEHMSREIRRHLPPGQVGILVGGLHHLHSVGALLGMNMPVRGVGVLDTVPGREHGDYELNGRPASASEHCLSAVGRLRGMSDGCPFRVDLFRMTNPDFQPISC